MAAIQGCAAESRDNPLCKWADKVWMRERSMRKELELEQGSELWHQRRKTGIGGTEAAAIVGAAYSDRQGNTTTARDVWETKVGDDVKGTPENAAMRRGKLKEPLARALYEHLYGWSVPPACVLHDDYEFVRASLDGLRGDDRLIVEIKSCGEANHRKLLAIQEITDPLARQTTFCHRFNYYRYQVLLQLLITGADVCHFVGFNDDFTDHRQLAVVELYPEPAEQERLLQRLVEFWQFVERREPPPVEWCLPSHRPPIELKVPDIEITSGV